MALRFVGSDVDALERRREGAVSVSPFERALRCQPQFVSRCCVGLEAIKCQRCASPFQQGEPVSAFSPRESME